MYTWSSLIIWIIEDFIFNFILIYKWITKNCTIFDYLSSPSVLVRFVFSIFSSLYNILYIIVFPFVLVCHCIGRPSCYLRLLITTFLSWIDLRMNCVLPMYEDIWIGWVLRNPATLVFSSLLKINRKTLNINSFVGLKT